MSRFTDWWREPPGPDNFKDWFAETILFPAFALFALWVPPTILAVLVIWVSGCVTIRVEHVDVLPNVKTADFVSTSQPSSQPATSQPSPDILDIITGIRNGMR